jgi:hypothetical protein
MRKLLHAIHGMLRTDTDFSGEKFFAFGVFRREYLVSRPYSFGGA